jgi:hypothetical protein
VYLPSVQPALSPSVVAEAHLGAVKVALEGTAAAGADRGIWAAS